MKITKNQSSDKDYEALLSQAGDMVDSGNLEKAIDRYNSVIEKFGYSSRTAALRGYVFYKSGDYDEAVKDLKFASDNEKRAKNTLFILGRSYAELGNLDDALKSFRRVIEVDPETADAYTEAASILAYREQTEEAYEMLKTALHYNPEDKLAKSILEEIQLSHKGPRE